MSLTFFVDECLDSPQFTDPLIDAGIKFRLHREFFKNRPRIPDRNWMKVVSEKGYYGLTKDNRIGKRGTERKMVRVLNIGIFIIRGTKPGHPRKGSLFVQYIENVLYFIQNNPRPFIAKITKKGIHGHFPENRRWRLNV